MQTRKNPKAWVILAALVLLLGGMGQYKTSAASMMYWTDWSTKKIQRANLDGSGVTDLITMGLRKLHNIALDTAGGKMYWTDSGLDSIQRANLNGSHIEVLVTTGLSAPIGIALDVDAGKMYWTDSLTHKIQRANLNGSGVEDLVTKGLQWPRTIALDIAGGKMYWVDAGTVKIQRANLDGSGVEDLITAGLGAPGGIALDVSAGNMYWADIRYHRIQRANLDGSDVEVLITTGGNLHGIALDIADGRMYWTDTLFDKIQRANLDGSGVEDLVTTGLDYPIGLALDVPKPPKIIYVDAEAPGNNNGSSWANAYNYLQDALAAAWIGDEIWVAEGIYKPDLGVGITPGDRTATFQLINGVVIKGGYAGFGEPDANERDIDAYETILSGDLDGNDIDVNEPWDLWDEPTRGENSYHVVTGSGNDETAVLEGFTITSGNDNRYERSPYYPSYWRAVGRGGGIYNDSGSPTLTNCTFIRNMANSSGGGMCNWDESSPTITNCTFSGNLAAGESAAGGGMHNYGSSPTLTNCTFSDNSTSYEGGGIYNYSSSLHITNCRFIGNSSYDSGGAVYIRGISNQTLSNCIFVDNSAKYIGGGMVINHCNPTLINCTFRNNKTESSGGGILCSIGSPTLINCKFIGNVAPGYGGGMINSISSSPILLNCTFSGNAASRKGGGICSYRASSPTLTNCIIWGNEAREGPQIAVVEVWDGSDPSMVTVSYSDVQGGEQDVYVGQGCALIWGEGNIDADPCFADPGYWDPNGTPDDVNDDFWVDGDYHLLPDSPCIDAGDPNYVAEPNETDLDGRPRVIGGRIDMGAYEFNHIPVADAGPDREVYAWIDGIAKVTLDGTGSYDDDGQTLSYLWRWISDGNTMTATGISPTIELPVGEHIIELIVNDGIDDSEPDEVVIIVIEPIEVAMQFTPQALNTDSRGKWVKAHFVLPAGFVVEDVDAGSPAKIEPLGIESEYINVFVNEAGLVEIEAAFGRAAFCGAATDYGPAEVTVVGLLASGQHFYGTDTIKIINKSFEYLGVLASHWLERGCGAPDWCGGVDLDHSSVVDFVDFAMFDGCCIEVIRQ